MVLQFVLIFYFNASEVIPYTSLKAALLFDLTVSVPGRCILPIVLAPCLKDV